jgi:chaperonin cofactor prefoldin
MDDTALDEVTEWDTRPVEDGYDGLRSLADGGFSGAVEAGRSRAYMVNGRILCVSNGRIDAFEGTPLTAYAAPEPSVAMLFAMRAADDDVRARYFTDDKPIAQADAELSNAGFTGYIELSENVLSGDYYVVYQKGTSSGVAYVGSSRRLVTGDEAFEQADEEVGIYEVHDTDLEVIQIPDDGPSQAPATGDPESTDESGETDSAPGGRSESDPGGGPSATERAAAGGHEPAVDEDTRPGRSRVGGDDAGGTDATGPDPNVDGYAADAAGTTGPGSSGGEPEPSEFDDGAGLDFDGRDGRSEGGRVDVEAGSDPGPTPDAYGGSVETDEDDARDADGETAGPSGGDAGPSDDAHGIDLEQSLTGGATPDPTGDSRTDPGPSPDLDESERPSPGGGDATATPDPDGADRPTEADADGDGDVDADADGASAGPHGETGREVDEGTGGDSDGAHPTHEDSDGTAGRTGVDSGGDAAQTDPEGRPTGAEGRESEAERADVDGETAAGTATEPDGDPGPDAGSAPDRVSGSTAVDAPGARSGTADHGDGTGHSSGEERTGPGSATAAGSGEAARDRFSAEAEWREDRAIPALDPEDTESSSTGDDAGGRGGDPAEAPSRTNSGGSGRDAGDEPQATVDGSATGAGDAGGAGEGGGRAHSDPDRPGAGPTGPGVDSPTVDAEADADPETEAETAGVSDRAGRSRPDAPPEASEAAGGSRPGDAGADDPRAVEQLRERLQAAKTARERAETARDEARAAREEAESALEDAEAELADLRETNESLARERDQYRERAEKLSGRVETLEGELERLRAETDRLQSELAAARERVDDGPDGERVPAGEALRGAHVMIRYDRAGGATLAKARDGAASREDVNGNLQLEYHHTRFDTESAVVDDETFEEFLTTTTEYRFVQWLVRELVYDVVETGNAEALDRLYDAIPEANRAEFDGGVTVPVGEDGEGHESLGFDVVIRDRMGNPLVVADMNKSRDAATEPQMSELVEKARTVGHHKEALAGAFLVTASFFDPAALETADAATDAGGILSRSNRRSFVKLSGAGFHLLLVETRGGSFHVNVPEL